MEIEASVLPEIVGKNIPLDMYTLPSQLKPISEHEFTRYIDCHRQDEKIIEIAKMNVDIKNLTGDQLLSYVNKDLDSSNIEVQKEAAGMIGGVLATEQLGLRSKVKVIIENAFEGDDIEVQKIAAEMIWNAPKTEREALIEKVLSLNNIEVQKIAAGMIWNAPRTERLDLRNKVKVIIEEAFEGDDIEVQKVAAGMIEFAPETKRKALIEKALSLSNIEVQKVAAEMTWSVFGTEQLELRNKVKVIIENAFEGDDVEVQKVAAGMISDTPKTEQLDLRNKVKVIIEKAFEGDDIEVQKVAAGMIGIVSRTELNDLLEKALSLNKEISNFVVRSPLYDKSNLNNETLGREKFSKTGSETTLIGGSLKEKTIVRHIRPKAFLAWKEIYENYELWQQAGFDYVPIEPIQSYSLRSNGLVDVFSGVMDLNLQQWEDKTTLFKDELEKQKEKILGVFNSLGFDHGHPHDKNFILCFYRNEDGTVDINRTPRLYAIDFDQAVST